MNQVQGRCLPQARRIRPCVPAIPSFGFSWRRRRSSSSCSACRCHRPSGLNPEIGALPPPYPTPKPTQLQTNRRRGRSRRCDPVNTTEILLPVTVRDNAGILVSNLTRKDFRVFEDGVEQSLSDPSLRQVPVDVALITMRLRQWRESDDFRNAAEGFGSTWPPMIASA